MPAISDIVTTSRASTGTYFDANGVLRTAANNEWRWNHDPVTKQSRGVLIEEQRINLIRNGSMPGSGAGWTASNVVRTEGAAIDPTGSMGAVLITENDVEGTHHLLANVAGKLAGVDFWNSVFVKKAPGSARNMAMIWCGSFVNHSKRTSTYINLDTGELYGTNGIDPEARVQRLSDGWFRVFIRGQAAGTGTVQLVVGLVSEGTTSSYLGDGISGLLVWGYQQEDGLFPTSYIPTAPEAATRAADPPRIVSGWSQPWFNPEEGTFIVEFETFDPTASKRLIDRASGSNGLLMSLESNPLGRAGGQVVNGAQTGSLTFGGKNAVGRLARSKMGFTYKLGETNGMSVDGLATSRGVSAVNALPGVAGDVRLGWSTISGGHFNGHILSITYEPRRLSDEELQAATVLT